MSVTFGTALKNTTASMPNPWTVGTITVISGQPIILWVTDPSFGDTVDSISDTFATPYTWTAVTAATDNSNVQPFIGTGGVGTSGSILIHSNSMALDGVSAIAVPCIGASTAAGLSAIDAAGKASGDTGPSLTPGASGEGATYLAAGAAPVGGPSSPWVLVTETYQSMALYASPPSGSPLAPVWTTASYIGGIIVKAGSAAAPNSAFLPFFQ